MYYSVCRWEATIRVAPEVKGRLDKLRVPRETYNEVIDRLTRDALEEAAEELADEISDIEGAIVGIKAGKVYSGRTEGLGNRLNGYTVIKTEKAPNGLNPLTLAGMGAFRFPGVRLIDSPRQGGNGEKAG